MSRVAPRLRSLERARARQRTPQPLMPAGEVHFGAGDEGDEERKASALVNGRLPRTIVPKSYDVRLKVDPNAGGFSGRVKIAVQVEKTSKTIVNLIENDNYRDKRLSDQVNKMLDMSLGRAKAARKAFSRESKAGREVLLRTDLFTLPYLRYSRENGVLVPVKPAS